MATIIVDHYSDLSYVHLKQDNSGSEMRQVKKLLKTRHDTWGRGKHYHAVGRSFWITTFFVTSNIKRNTYHVTGCMHFKMAKIRLRCLHKCWSHNTTFMAYGLRLDNNSNIWSITQHGLLACHFSLTHTPQHIILLDPFVAERVFDEITVVTKRRLFTLE